MSQQKDVLVNATSLNSLTVSGENPSEDICPVCKTSRYLNKDLEFLINPECYHPMCTNCVNRVFKDGPNQCPYAACFKTLRRKGFRPPWFNDLSVEREVDIRRRVMAVFNKVEDDFETLHDYNNYLERVEDLTEALVAGPDDRKRSAEAELLEWERAHKAEIEANKKRRGEAEERTRKLLQVEEQEARQRRLRAMHDDVEEKNRERQMREAQLDALATGDRNVANRIILHKRGHRSQQQQSSSSMAGTADLSIQGLKSQRKSVATQEDEPDTGPYDAFDGLDLRPTRFRMANPDTYHNEWVDTSRTKSDFRVGGYSAVEYVSRVLYEAFAGLAIFVDEEHGDATTTPSSQMEIDA